MLKAKNALRNSEENKKNIVPMFVAVNSVRTRRYF